MRKYYILLFALCLNGCFFGLLEKKIEVKYINPNIEIEESDKILIFPTLLLRNGALGQKNLKEMFDQFCSGKIQEYGFNIVEVDLVKNLILKNKLELEGNFLRPSEKTLEILKKDFSFKYIFRILVTSHLKEGSFSEKTIFLTLKIYDTTGKVIRVISYQYQGEEDVASKEIFSELEKMIKKIMG